MEMLMQPTRLIALGLLVLMLPAPSAVAQSKDGEALYKLLATTRTGTMQKEVDEAAAQGYRVLMGSPTSGTEMALFMHRIATPPQIYSYKILATSRTGTMEKELNEAAEGGFRLMLSTMIAKKQVIGPVEIVL